MSYYPFTLGYLPNPILENYQDAFVQKLEALWIENISQDIPPREFLLFPDMHALLLSGIRPGNIERDISFSILKEEFDKYNINQGFIYNEKEFIPGTNIALTLDFNNPDINSTTHPEHKKNAVGITFGSKNSQEWHILFAQIFDIIRQVSPGFMGEINSIIRKIIPFDVSQGVHNSGSYSDVIGHLTMSYPVGMSYPELALLEAILHEYNHNKLNIIAQTNSLVLNDRQELYYSPYRPDARHIHGIYFGLHAITGAYWTIWNAHLAGIITLRKNWLEKAVLSVLKNGLSLQVLDKYAQLSPLGKEILEEMRLVHKECLVFIKKANLPQEIMERTKFSLINHFQEVQKNYPHLKS